MKRVTFQNAPHAQPRSLERSVLQNCLACVLGTGRRETAACGKCGRDESLIESDESRKGASDRTTTRRLRRNFFREAERIAYRISRCAFRAMIVAAMHVLQRMGERSVSARVPGPAVSGRTAERTDCTAVRSRPARDAVQLRQAASGRRRDGSVATPRASVVASGCAARPSRASSEPRTPPARLRLRDVRSSDTSAERLPPGDSFRARTDRGRRPDRAVRALAATGSDDPRSFGTSCI